MRANHQRPEWSPRPCSEETTEEWHRRWRAANPEKVRLQPGEEFSPKANKRIKKNRRLSCGALTKRLLRHRMKNDGILFPFKGLPTPTRPMPKSCEICGRSIGKKALHLDHCHATDTFRGWLCGQCNSGLGLLGDNAESVKKALDYLIKSSN